jgi:hypothetical protein
MFKPALPQLTHHVWRGAVALSALALTVTACGSPGAGNHPTGSGTGSASAEKATGPTYKGTIYVSSQNDLGPAAWHVIKEFTEPLKGVRTCADAAKGSGSGVFQVPSGKAPVPEDDILIYRFHGPGTYPPDLLKRDKLDTILVPGKTGLDQYDITTSAHGRKSGREVLFLNGNGSGELVYSNAHLDGRATSPAVAGLISWTCTS